MVAWPSSFTHIQMHIHYKYMFNFLLAVPTILPHLKIKHALLRLLRLLCLMCIMIYLTDHWELSIQAVHEGYSHV